MTYQLIGTNLIQKTVEGESLFIPVDEGNVDYQEYLKWKEEGGIASSAAPSLPSAQQLLDELERSSMMNRGMREFLIISMQDLANRQALGVPEKASAILAALPAWKKIQQLNDEAIRLRSLL